VEQDFFSFNVRNAFSSLGILLISVVGLVYFEGVIKPIIVAIFFWFIIKELRHLLGRLRINGKTLLPGFWSGLSALFVIALVIFGIFELLSVNAQLISEQAPEYRQKLDELITELSGMINNPQLIEYVREGISEIKFAGMVGELLNSVSSWAGSFVVVVVYVIFMLLEESHMPAKLKALFPEKGKDLDAFNEIMNKVDKAVRAYLSSMVAVSFLTGLLSYFALIILRVDFPVLWAFLVFILNFIPYIGPFISSTLPALLATLQYGELIWFVYTFGVLEVIQFLLGSIVQPRVMGKSMNISALTVLIALAFWGSIWGVGGMILAVPIASFILIIFYQFKGTRPIAILLSENGNMN